MNSNSGRLFARVVAGSLLGLLASTTTFAQSTNAQGLISNSFVLSAGAFIVGTDVRARLNGSSTTNPEIDFDDTFGTGSDSTRARADALWRFTPRHHLRFLYFNNSITRNKVLERDVAVG